MPVLFPEIPGFEYNRSTGQHFCKVCQVPVTGSAPAREHLKGMKHKRKLQIAGETGHDLAYMMEGLNLLGSGKTPTSPLDAPNSLIDTVLYPQVDGTYVPQDASPKPATDEIARAGYPPAVVETGYNGELVRMGTMWKCVICGVQLNSDKTIRQHFIGKAHQKKKKSMIGLDGAGTLPEDIEKNPGSTLLRCKVCNVKLSGVVPMKDHLSGMAHLKNKKVNQSYPLSASVLLNPTRVSAQSALTPTRTNNAQGHTSPRYTPDPRKAAADQNDTRYIDRRSGDAAEVHGSGIPPLTNSQPFPQDPPALSVDPSPLMSPSTKPPLGSPSTRPPPGFEAVNPSQFRQENPNLLGITDVDVHISPGHTGPLADFLNHQRVATQTQPSHMHNFWSLSPEDQRVSGERLPWTENVTRTPPVAPIGTLCSPTTTVRVDQKDGQSQDLLKTEFTFDPRTQRFICNTCRIEVSGAENAGSHLRGANHAKKVKALQCQLDHMPPLAAPPAGVTEYQPAGPTSDRPNFAAASPYPPSPSGRLNDGPESSIEVLRQEGRNHSVSFEISAATDSGLHTYNTGPNGGISNHWDVEARSLRGVSLFQDNSTSK